jgi:hypothetical protein
MRIPVIRLQYINDLVRQVDKIRRELTGLFYSFPFRAAIKSCIFAINCSNARLAEVRQRVTSSESAIGRHNTLSSRPDFYSG